MKNPVGFSLAIAATASLAIAGGDDDKDKKANNSRTLSSLGSGAATQGGAATVTGGPGEGFTIAVGEDFSVTIKNRAQVLWSYVTTDAPGAADQNTFTIPRLRTSLSGHVWDKDMTYLLQVDWIAGVRDAWFRWGVWQSEDNSIALRVGQQKPHHGKEFQGSSAYLEFINRSIASQAFSGSRVVGAFLQGEHLEGDKLHWNVGVGNSDPAGASSAVESGTGATNPDNEINFFFDVRLDPWGDMGDEKYEQGDLEQTQDVKGQVGASLMVGNNRTLASAAGTDVESTSINIYTAWKYQGLHALGEIFIRTDDPDVGAGTEADSTGWALGASYTLPAEGKSQWGFAARYSMIDSSDPPVSGGIVLPIGGTGAGDIQQIEGNISNYYHKHKLKTQVGYAHQTINPDTGGTDIDSDIIQIQFQWIF